jgi:hypothetical protein
MLHHNYKPTLTAQNVNKIAFWRVFKWPLKSVGKKNLMIILNTVFTRMFM